VRPGSPYLLGRLEASGTPADASWLVGAFEAKFRKRCGAWGAATLWAGLPNDLIALDGTGVAKVVVVAGKAMRL
jgi:hypothetical protein